MTQEHVQQAIKDIEIIRRAIERAEVTQKPDGSGPRSILNAQLCLQGAMVVLGLALYAYEMTTYQTGLLLSSVTDASVATSGVWSLAGFAAVLVFGFYGFAALRAKAAAKSVDDFVREHFHSLRNFSIASDAVIKLAIVSVVILGGAPELVAPIVSLFVADYLFQGRAFVMSLPLSIVGGAVCTAIALIQFHRGDASLDIPLLVFVTVSAISMLTVLWEKTSLKSA